MGPFYIRRRHVLVRHSSPNTIQRPNVGTYSFRREPSPIGLRPTVEPPSAAPHGGFTFGLLSEESYPQVYPLEIHYFWALPLCARFFPYGSISSIDALYRAFCTRIVHASFRAITLIPTNVLSRPSAGHNGNRNLSNNFWKI